MDYGLSLEPRMKGLIIFVCVVGCLDFEVHVSNFQSIICCRNNQFSHILYKHLYQKSMYVCIYSQLTFYKGAYTDTYIYICIYIIFILYNIYLVV